MIAFTVVDQEREAAPGQVGVARRRRRRRNVGARCRAQVCIELVDEALAGKADYQRAGNDQRGGEQEAERQQQPRSEGQSDRVT